MPYATRRRDDDDDNTAIDLEWLKEEKRRMSEESGTGPTGPHKCTCNPSEMKPLLLTSLHLSFSNHINPNTILGNAVSNLRGAAVQSIRAIVIEVPPCFPSSAGVSKLAQNDDKSIQTIRLTIRR